MRYRGIVERVGQGFLLGGVKKHVSIAFDTEAEAKAWTEVILAGNKSVGITQNQMSARVIPLKLSAKSKKKNPRTRKSKRRAKPGARSIKLTRPKERKNPSKSIKAKLREALDSVRNGARESSEIYGGYHLGTVSYLRTPRGIVRIRTGPDGQKFSERLVEKNPRKKQPFKKPMFSIYQGTRLIGYALSLATAKKVAQLYADSTGKKITIRSPGA